MQNEQSFPKILKLGWERITLETNRLKGLESVRFEKKKDSNGMDLIGIERIEMLWIKWEHIGLERM